MIHQYIFLTSKFRIKYWGTPNGLRNMYKDKMSIDRLLLEMWPYNESYLFHS